MSTIELIVSLSICEMQSLSFSLNMNGFIIKISIWCSVLQLPSLFCPIDFYLVHGLSKLTVGSFFY